MKSQLHLTLRLAECQIRVSFALTAVSNDSPHFAYHVVEKSAFRQITILLKKKKKKKRSDVSDLRSRVHSYDWMR